MAPKAVFLTSKNTMPKKDFSDNLSQIHWKSLKQSKITYWSIMFGCCWADRKTRRIGSFWD